jgi:hypothetical protein
MEFAGYILEEIIAYFCQEISDAKQKLHPALKPFEIRIQLWLPQPQAQALSFIALIAAASAVPAIYENNMYPGSYRSHCSCVLRIQASNSLASLSTWLQIEQDYSTSLILLEILYLYFRSLDELLPRSLCSWDLSGSTA